MSEPLISVVILSYNNSKYIGRCIESILSQDVPSLELIVLDDASTDDSEEVISRYLVDERMRYVRNEINLGMVPNSDKAYQSGDGKYFAILPSDDYFYPGHLKDLVDALEANPNCILAYSPCYWVDDDERVIKLATHPGHSVQSYSGGRNELADLLIYDNYITPSAAVIRRKELVAEGPLDSAIKGAGDWDMWCRLARTNPDFAFVNKASVAYRIHAGQVSNQFYASADPLTDHLAIVEKFLYSDAAHRLRGSEDQMWTHIENRAKGHAQYLNQETLKRIESIKLTLDGMKAGEMHKTKIGGPLVSVIVPTHNRLDLLIRALQSIKAQTYPNIEIVVVNDAGVEVENIIQSLGKDVNICYVRHGKNRGLAAARNTGLSVARGEIIAYLDDDDIYQENHIETVVQAISKGADIVYTDAEYVEENWVNGRRTELVHTPFINIAYTKEQLHIHNFIPVNSWVHRKACLTTTGLFDETLDNHEDWDLLLRFSRAFTLIHIPKITVQVHQRVQGDSMLRRERPKFYDTYKLIYARYDDLCNAQVAAGRRQMLENLLHKGEPLVAPQTDPAQVDYLTWRSKRSLQEIDAQLFAERMTLVWKARPIFQIVLILAPGEESLLADTLDSLGAQFYTDWRLTVVAGFPAPDAVFHEVAQLRWIEARTDSDRLAAMNALIADAETDWLLLAPPGVVLEPHTLIRCGDYVNLHPAWRLIYCDDDRINASGEFAEPRFKPEFNLDLLRSTDYIGPCLFRADALRETGGYSCLTQVERYDMALRVLDRYEEQAIGHISDVLLHLPSSCDAIGNEENAREAVSQHLTRLGIQGRVEAGYARGTQRVVYEHAENPMVSIIIPNRDKLEFLQPCVESLLEKTSYADYEILIVDNQSSDPDVLDYYDELRQRFPDRVQVLSFNADFNFAAMNNLAAQAAKGEYLVLLNNDTQIVQGEWLERLLSYGQRADVGVVGARLVYPESGKLQHAGLVLGMNSIAGHPFNGLSINDPGYMARAQVDQNYSAVTAACLLIRKSLYEQVGGMDAEHLKVVFNDVDLCLKVCQLGYKIVWTPYATAVHHGSTSLKSETTDLMKLALSNERTKQEQATMFARWLPLLANDPAYNRHLSFASPGYQVESTVVIDWDTNFHDRPRILGAPLSGGSGEYRVIAPFRALSRAGRAHCDVLQAHEMFKTRVLRLVEIERAKPDTLVLHSAIDDMQMDALASYKQFNQEVLRVLTLDDLLTQVPKDNSFYRYSYKDAKPRLRKVLTLCDRLIVSTEPLAALCRPMIEDIHIIPNRLESSLWGNLKSQRRQGKKPRVGWAGAQQHKGDLALIVDVVKQTAAEVDWVFFGMCPDELRPYVSEFHEFLLSFKDYPAKLASLNLDLAVAPLEVHAFNEAKSNLRLLEYGLLGWPVVCTDIYPYQDAPVMRVPNETAAWVAAIRARVNDLDASEREGQKLAKWVRDNFMLEDHLDQWLSALTR